MAWADLMMDIADVEVALFKLNRSTIIVVARKGILTAKLRGMIG